METHDASKLYRTFMMAFTSFNVRPSLIYSWTITDRNSFHGFVIMVAWFKLGKTTPRSE